MNFIGTPNQFIVDQAYWRALTKFSFFGDSGRAISATISTLI